MSNADVVSAERDWPPINPWHLLIFAGAAALLSLAVSFLGWTLPTVLLLLAGLIAGGGAVALQPKSPAVLGWAAAVAAVSSFALDPAWDSARLVVMVLAAVALLAAGLVALPGLIGRVYASQAETAKQAEQMRERGTFVGRMLSRAVISVFVLVHFTGIFCAFMSVPPPGRDTPWLAMWGWNFLAPYLQFTYLTNAYRFYSPEPGPAFLLWFYIDYSDGSSREVRVPNREEHNIDPLGQEYTRHLSICDLGIQIAQTAGIPDEIMQRRLAAERDGIPRRPGMSHDAQYRVPTEPSKRNLSEFARFVAQHYPSEKDPSAKPIRVRVYRVTHAILEPGEMGNPDEFPDPAADWTYLPYFQGEFVRPKLDLSKLRTAPQDGWVWDIALAAGAPLLFGLEDPDPNKPWVLNDPDDRLLYWLIPIYREWQPAPDPNNPRSTIYRPVTHDYLEKHISMKPKQGGQ